MPMLLFRVSDPVYRNPALEMRHFIFRNPQFIHLGHRQFACEPLPRDGPRGVDDYARLVHG
jgi:hypothetical protein